MRSDLPDLPPGVTYLGDSDSEPETYESTDGGLTLQVVRARYLVHGLVVEIGWTAGHPMGGFSAPDRLRISFDSQQYGMAQDDPEFSGVFNGVTTSVLRSVPLAHARALMRGTYERLSVEQTRREITPLPARVETDRDYVHVAEAYVSLAAGRSAEPVKRLCEWTGESADTWSARLRRARSKGILMGTGRKASIAPRYRGLVSEIYSELAASKGAEHGSAQADGGQEAVAG